MILALLSCTSTPEETATLEQDVDAERMVRRLSLDLRGTLPSLDEMDTVSGDPSQLWTLRDQWLEEAALEARLLELFSEQLWTRVDSFNIEETDYNLSEADGITLAHAVGEEPLRLMVEVATSDAPWGEIVTADWTMADAQLAEIWPIEREAGEGWQRARYTDDRPTAGILSTNGLWWRYTTTFSNLNRARVAALMRILLCEDILARPISFDEVDLLSDAEQLDQPACTGCHSSIDPLATTLFGFWWVILYNADEMSHYHPERESMGVQMLEQSPAYFGVPVNGLSDVGALISKDPRFSRCTAETMSASLWRRPVDAADFDTISALTEDFIAQGATMRGLLAAITETAAYQDPTPRLLSAGQLASVHQDLTGLSWTREGLPVMDNDQFGLRVLAGGIDGEQVTTPLRGPTLPWALVVKRMAEVSAAHAVEQELVADGPRRLFSTVRLTDAPDSEPFAAELTALERRLLGAALPADEHAALVSLWEALEESSDAQAAWSGVVSVMMRDPAFVAW